MDGPHTTINLTRVPSSPMSPRQPAGLINPLSTSLPTPYWHL